MNILSTEMVVIGAEMTEMKCFEHMVLFWQFVPSLSPRITGLPVRKQACSEPKILPVPGKKNKHR
jgi:hypothetical protein